MKRKQTFSVRPVGLLASGLLFVASCAALVPQSWWQRHASAEARFCDATGLCSRTRQIDAGLNGLRRDPGSPPAAALAGLRAAVQSDPASPFRWADVGEAYLLSGDRKMAERCFLRGRDLAPNSPAMEFRLAAYYLRVGETETALPHLANLLKRSRHFDEIAFSYLDRMGFGVRETLASAMIQDSGSANAFFQYLRSTGRDGDGLTVWRWLAARGWAQESQAKQYAAQLLQSHRLGATAEAWSAYRNGVPGRPERHNLVENAGFESAPSASVFDWSIEKNDQAAALRDCQEAHGGRCSLRIRFDAHENLSYQGISQPVVVAAGAYRFAAFLKTNDITTDQGVRFRIADMESPGRLEVITDAVRGSGGWREVSQRFLVPPATQVVSIQVVRSRSDKFENRIKGTVWIDDVSVIAEGGK